MTAVGGGRWGERFPTTGLSAEKTLSALAVSHFQDQQFLPQKLCSSLTRSLSQGTVTSSGQRRSPVSAEVDACWSWEPLVTYQRQHHCLTQDSGPRFSRHLQMPTHLWELRLFH